MIKNKLRRFLALSLACLLSLPALMAEATGASWHSPYSVPEVQALGSPGTDAYVRGFIVGTINSDNVMETQAPFSSTGDIVLAATPGETDFANCIAVELRYDIQYALSPAYCSYMLKSEVTIRGKLRDYCGKPGIRTASEYRPIFKGTPEGDGTVSNPFNTAAVIETWNTSEPVWIEGVVCGMLTDAGEIQTEPPFTDVNYILISDDGNTSQFVRIVKGYDTFDPSYVPNLVGKKVKVLGKLNNGTVSDAHFRIGTPEGDGTVSNPFNTAAVIETWNASEPVWIEGVVCGMLTDAGGIQTEPPFTKTNCTLISDDGNTSQYVRVYYDYKTFSPSYNPAIIGKKVKVHGKLYGGTVSDAHFRVGTPEGDGTVSNPFNTAAVIETWNTSEPVWIKGIVCGVLTRAGEVQTEPPFTDVNSILISEDGNTAQYMQVAANSIFNPYYSPHLIGKEVKVLGQVTLGRVSNTKFRVKSPDEPEPPLWNSEADTKLFNSTAQQFYDIDGDGILEVTGTDIIKPYYDNLAYLGVKIGTLPSKPGDITGRHADGKIYAIEPGYGDRGALSRFNEWTGGTLEIEQLHTPGNVAPVDYDMDGTPDFLILRREAQSSGTSATTYDYFPTDDALAINADGSVSNEHTGVFTPEQYAGVRSELKLSKGGEGIPGVGSEMFGRDGVGSLTGSETRYTRVDLNGDGLTDYVNTYRGICLLNAGPGIMVRNSLRGDITMRDMNGDGMTDIIYKDSATKSIKIAFQQRDGSSEEQTINSTGRVLACRDVDHDGDIDIIVAIDENSTDKYLIIYENQGKGTFRKREQYLGQGFSFNGVIDINADGKYEVFTNGGCYYTIDTPSSISGPVTVPITLKSGSSGNPGMQFANLDNSGRMAIINYRLGSLEGVYVIPDMPLNRRPQAPGRPSLKYDEANRLLEVSWTAGSDAETSAADLTYEVRIGTAPGLDDIVAAQALADGTRRISANGANGYERRTTYSVDSWPAGDVYISVQSVDANYLGSEFSEASVFHKTEPSRSFNISSPKGVCIGQEVSVALASAPERGYSYAWDLGESAQILTESAEGVKATYSTPGVKTITLTVTGPDGSTKTSSRTLDIAPAAFKQFNTFNTTIDFDSDGQAELMDYDTLLKENSEGVYESVKKSFNPLISSGYKIIDADRDGLADLMTSSSGNNIVYHNYGDGDMERFTTPNPSGISWSEYDFNNDGLNDAYLGDVYRRNGNYSEHYSSINTGDYSAVEEGAVQLTPRLGSQGFYPVGILYYDFNADGLMDVAFRPGLGEFGIVEKLGDIHIYENIDGRSFKQGVPVTGLSEYPAKIDDLDGDGKPDLVMCNTGYSFGFGVSFFGEYISIIWGSGATTTKIQCPDGAPFASVNSCFDVNNDGMKDILVKCEGGETNYVVYLFPDHSASIKPTYGGNGSDSNAVAYRSNGNLLLSGNEITAVANSRPTPPTNLRASQNDSRVVIEWNPGTDAETPAAGLKYNIGIKHRGASGEGAYFKSPYIGENADVALPSPITLLNGTRFTIPLASIPAGEYEVKVQSVDGRMTGSEFSEPYILKVLETSAIDMPASAMIDRAVEVTVRTNAQSAKADFGSDATVESTGTGKYTVTWHTVGMKTVKINGIAMGELYVYAEPVTGFTCPDNVVLGAEVRIDVPEARFGTWLADNEPMGADAPVEQVGTGEDYVTVRFLKAGRVDVTRVREESYGSASTTRTVTVTEAGSTPALEMVTADADNHYTLTWSAESAPHDATAIRIYREGSRYNDYELIAELPVTSVAFTDLDSKTDVKAERYRMAYVLPYGETRASEAHQPMHVQINKGLAGAINLMWTPYEGLGVTSYGILRGTTPDNLEVLDVVSGHITSYSDVSPVDGGGYYAVEITGSASARSASRAARKVARSNVVAGADASDAVLAEKVFISTSTGNTDVLLCGAKPLQQLSAHFLPVNTSLNRVNWEVVEGDNMTVDAYGNVTASGFGNARIRAYACDGSGAYGEIELWARLPKGYVTTITFGSSLYNLHPGEQLQLTPEVKPDNAFNKTLRWSSSDPANISVDQNGLVTVAPDCPPTVCIIKAEATDGSPVTGEVMIQVNPILAESLALITDIQSLKCGESRQLVVEVVPENTTDKSLRWSVVDPGILTVDNNGLVTANSNNIPGLGWVCVETLDGSDLKLRIPINVIGDDTPDVPDVVLVESIDIIDAVYKIEVGSTVHFTAVVKPDNATDKSLRWESEDESIATVDNDGNVTGVAVGGTFIFTFSNDSNCGLATWIDVIEKQQDSLDEVETAGISIAIDGADIIVRNVPAGQSIKLFTTSGVMMRGIESAGADVRLSGIHGQAIIVTGRQAWKVTIK